MATEVRYKVVVVRGMLRPGSRGSVGVVHLLLVFVSWLVVAEDVKCG